MRDNTTAIGPAARLAPAAPGQPHGPFWQVIRMTDRVRLFRMIDGHSADPFIVEVTPARSLRHRQHSPDGYEFGYGGSAPAQLALAILLDATTEDFALDHYEAFKTDFVAPQHFNAAGRVNHFTVTATDIAQWSGARLMPWERRIEPCPTCAAPLPAPMRCQGPSCPDPALEDR